MKLPRWSFVIFGLLGLLTANMRAAEPKPAPAAEKKPVFNEYQGIKGRGRLSMAGERQRPGGQGLVECGEQATRAYLDRLPAHAAIEKH